MSGIAVFINEVLLSWTALGVVMFSVGIMSVGFYGDNIHRYRCVVTAYSSLIQLLGWVFIAAMGVYLLKPDWTWLCWMAQATSPLWLGNVLARAACQLRGVGSQTARGIEFRMLAGLAGFLAMVVYHTALLPSLRTEALGSYGPWPVMLAAAGTACGTLVLLAWHRAVVTAAEMAMVPPAVRPSIEDKTVRLFALAATKVMPRS